NGLSRVIKVNSPAAFLKNSRVLTAIQKNNRLRWITDWYRYYREEFGVDYLVLYDNGSAYQDELDELISDDSITIVRWNFPYGPSISHENKFTQIGALNHCRRVFGRDSWIFSFDVDELLADPYGCVRRNLSRRSVHYFPSYFVPFIEDLPQDYSFASFQKRRRDLLLTGKKYIYRANRSTGVLPHYVHSHKIRILDNITVLIKKAMNRTRWKNNQKDNMLVTLLNLLLRLFVLGKRQYDYKPDEAYFLHFKGITTNWKRRGNRLAVEESDNDLVSDSVLTEISKRDSGH
ncbi:MAG: glycosyltransferase family 92 protein, partial [Spirochaetaceae bacterium]|nr:glycosyltransferase family 92 protein [Spirochaetaceae bacterium]